MERFHRSNFDSGATRLEAFARPLFAVIPLLRTGLAGEAVDRIPATIAEGTTPSSPAFWGDPDHPAVGRHERDQRIVESAVLGWGLAVAPQVFWEPLSKRERTRFARWLTHVRKAECGDNNWRYFRVLVNLGLRRVGAPHSWADVEGDLRACAAWRLPEGWYTDGPTRRIDYYVPWAMHFYPLLLHEMAEREPRMAKFTVPAVDHAREFAPHFAAWFADTGAALPYGRSLSYRFAQGAFWAAAAWASVEVLPWEQVRQLLAQHLRWWSEQPIIDATGCLTPGYANPNQLVVERYISRASPYWAMKALIVAGLPHRHPFWCAREEARCPVPLTIRQVAPGLIIHRHDGGRHVTALAAGQWAEWSPRHTSALYAKFAYSTAFAFSVQTGQDTLGEAALDNTLAFSADGISHWHPRGECETTGFDDEGWLISRWSPLPTVHVVSWLGIAGPWQVRVHHVATSGRIHTAEGGCAVPVAERPIVLSRRIPGARVACQSATLAAGLVCGLRRRTAQVVQAGPNSNLLHGRTVIPTLTGSLRQGRHWLVTFAPLPSERAAFDRVWRQPAPRVVVAGNRVMLFVRNRPIRVFRAPAESARESTGAGMKFAFRLPRSG